MVEEGEDPTAGKKRADEDDPDRLKEYNYREGEQVGDVGEHDAEVTKGGFVKGTIEPDKEG